MWKLKYWVTLRIKTLKTKNLITKIKKFRSIKLNDKMEYTKKLKSFKVLKVSAYLKFFYSFLFLLEIAFWKCKKAKKKTLTTMPCKNIFNNYLPFC